ncbi:MAG TPA: NAD(P)-dependent alcohol dehydrogenase [Geminicoccaceae bacterium]
MQIEGAWGPENIRLAERPEPEPGPGEVVIGMRAVSINPRDLIMSRGGYGRRGGSLPLVPLCDGAGEVVAVGEGVRRAAIGDLVCPTYSRTWLAGPLGPDSLRGAHGGPLDGTMQERMLIPEEAVVKAPRHLSAAEAATLPCAAVTAWNALVEQGGIRAGDAVLLQGTGGVSLFALQVAKLHGALVILTSSSDAKLERAKAMGADHLINYRSTPDWHRRAHEITAGRGVDHVVEVGGADTLERSIRAVRPGGTISMIGVLGGSTPELGLGRVVTRNIRLQGVTVGSRATFEAMVRAMELHALRPAIHDQRFAFEEVGAALQALPEGRHFGKVVSEF